MADYITHFSVHQHDADEEMLQSQGLQKIHVNLNKSSGEKPSYLWYKKGDKNCLLTIIGIQLTFNVQMSVGLIKAGYENITCSMFPAPDIWMLVGPTDGRHVPIVDVDITSDVKREVQMFPQGWEKLDCDLNRNNKGDWVHIWVKREKQSYICDIIVTDSFILDKQHFDDGYIRLDEDAHRGVGKSFTFIWYRRTTDPKDAICDLKVSTTTEEFEELYEQQYKPVNFDFNGWTGSDPIYLWYKKEGGNKPIKNVNLLLNMEAVPDYKHGGVTVIEKSLNTGSKGQLEYLCFYQ